MRVEVKVKVGVRIPTNNSTPSIDAAIQLTRLRGMVSLTELVHLPHYLLLEHTADYLEVARYMLL